VSALPEDERNSLLGRFGYLQKEWISKTGQNLAREKLGDKTYEGKSGAEFPHTFTNYAVGSFTGKNPSRLKAGITLGSIVRDGKLTAEAIKAARDIIDHTQFSVLIHSRLPVKT
jgi:hypothetical protein